MSSEYLTMYKSNINFSKRKDYLSFIEILICNLYIEIPTLICLIDYNIEISMNKTSIGYSSKNTI